MTSSPRKVRWQTMVLFSASGAGKTTLSATAPKPLFLDSNQGMTSIDNVPEFAHVQDMTVNNFSDLDKAYDRFSGTSNLRWDKKFNTIVFDHFDEIQQLILDELTEARMLRDSRKNADEIEQRDWGIMGNRLRRYIRKFKALPCHKIFICGEKSSKDDGRMIPSISGALSQQLPYLCDHVGYIRIGTKGRRYLHLDPTDDFYAKTRLRWLTTEQKKIPLALNNFTALTDFFALIAAGPKKPTPTKRGKTTEAK